MKKLKKQTLFFYSILICILNNYDNLFSLFKIFLHYNSDRRALYVFYQKNNFIFF